MSGRREQVRIGRVMRLPGDGVCVVMGSADVASLPTPPTPKPAFVPPSLKMLAEEEVRHRVRWGVAISLRWFRKRYGVTRRQVRMWEADERARMRGEWMDDPMVRRWLRP